MPDRFLLHVGPAARDGSDIIIGGHRAVFRRYLRGGETVYAAPVPDNDDGDDLIMRSSPHPHFVVVSRSQLRPWTPTRQAEADSPAAVAVTTTAATREALKQALGMGWLPDQLIGAGQGHPGDEGGRSPITGLTALEMALVTPPPLWATRAATSYPWELPGWTAPGPGWKPPSMPAKTEGKPAEPEQATSAPRPIAEPLPDAAEVAKAAAAEAPTTPEPTATEPAGDEDPAIAAGYPADQIEQARALAWDLASRHKDGKLYHPNALNFILRKATLASVNKTKLAALLARPPHAKGD